MRNLCVIIFRTLLVLEFQKSDRLKFPIFPYQMILVRIQLCKERRIPIKTYIFLSFITVTTMGCANKSLGLASTYTLTHTNRFRTLWADEYPVIFVGIDYFKPTRAYMNYPTQVIFKCCNLIPVMIGGMLIQKKVYNRFDFLAVMLMTIGLIFFTLGDSESSPDFNATGVSRFSARWWKWTYLTYEKMDVLTRGKVQSGRSCIEIDVPNFESLS